MVIHLEIGNPYMMGISTPTKRVDEFIPYYMEINGSLGPSTYMGVSKNNANPQIIH